MSNQTSVRFAHNFIMTVIQTSLDEEGKISITEKKVHVAIGDVYTISQYQELPDGKVTLEFPETSPIAGVAERLEAEYCLIHTPAPPASKEPVLKRGCGGCGSKR